MNALSTLPQLPEAAQTPLGYEVYRGLISSQKSLSPWLFYDAEGSRLFEQITELPEYYPTRTERGILAERADEILEEASQGHRLGMIELGAGTATKTGLLLEAAVRQQGSICYVPIDVSAAALEEAAQRIEERLPGVTVLPQVADYTCGLPACNSVEGEKRLVLYIGSSIGNFEPSAARELLRDVRSQLMPGDSLLLGVDMVKPESVLVPAYADAAGVTAAFNLNVLRRINEELRGDFNLDKFRHRAFWNKNQSRIEMHLVSVAEQSVSIAALELDLKFRRGESIHTENSYKFTSAAARLLLEDGGFVLRKSWFDEQGWFGVFLADIP
jgi:L-histidine N-alpha-methyltransferase